VVIECAHNDLKFLHKKQPFVLHFGVYKMIQRNFFLLKKHIFLPYIIQSELIQPQRRHFGILAVTSAKTDKIFWKIFEETLSRWLIRTTFLQKFPHPHFRF
jgi:hypothetical protein